MSLLVHFPLNGSLENIGCSAGVTFTGTPVWANDGKIGKCLYLDKLNLVATIPEIQNLTTYTITWWAKVNSSGTYNDWAGLWRLYAKCGASTCVIRCELRNQSNPGNISCYLPKDATVGSNTNAYQVCGSERSEAKDKWGHFALTKDATGGKFYANGVYISSISSSSFETTQGYISGALHFGQSTSYGCPAWMNDWRLYDTALSPREIKEISKGLVVHYKLDGPVSNLVSNSEPLDLAGWSAAGTSWANTLVDCSIAPFGKAIRSTYTGSGGNTGGMHHQPQDYTKLVNGATYTLSAWIRASKNCHVSFYNEYMSTTGSTQITTEWKKYSWTSIIDTSGSYHSNICYANTTSEITTNMWIEVFGFKLEQSSHATPWTPNTSDAAYAAMGYNDAVEPDVSGYGYNATKMGTFSSVADTARYSSCYVFSGSNYIKMDPSLYQTMRLARDEVTASIWAYRDNWKDYATSGSSTQWDTMFSCQEAGGFTIYETTLGSFTFVIGTGSSSNTYKTAGVGNAYAGNLSAGWHHFALTYNGLDLKGYIDGNLVKTTNCYTTKTQIWYYTGATTVFIGAEASSGTGAPVGGYYWRGRLSDFRVYDTALSDTEIKELYNTPVSIANNGAMLVAGEIVEV